jgi:hypothetical protein
MPRKPIDYSKNLNYKLVCNDLSVKYVYVGHTTHFTNRKRSHKKSCINENDKCYNFKVYKIIRENGGWENFTMVEIEKYPCNDINEATKRERYWYEELNANMNSARPNRTPKEYKEENKETIKEYKKEWRKKNKENYYEKNKEKILKKNREQITCECSCIIRKDGLAEHIKTKKHQKFMNNQQGSLHQ